LKILLYRPEAETAFKLYTKACEVIIPSGHKEVLIVNPETYNGIDESAILARYKLIDAPFTGFTDDTKKDSELMVKLIVEPIE